MVEGPAPRYARNPAPFVWGGFEPFVSPATGRVISDRAQHRDDLRAAGCHVVEKGEREPFKPVNPKYAARPDYDPDYSKEWYSKRADAVRPADGAEDAVFHAPDPESGTMKEVRVASRVGNHANPHVV